MTPMAETPQPPSEDSTEPRHHTWFWIAIAVACAVWYVWFRVVAPLGTEPFRGPLHGNDFKHMYIGAWMLARGESPYDAEAIFRRASQRGLGTLNPYVYLPFTGLALSPLAMLDPPAAFRVWFLANHALFLAALALMFLSGGFERAPRDVALFALVAALCYSFQRTLTAGQLSVALLFLFSLVFFLDARGRQIAGGVAAAFAFLFKLTPGILFLYFLARRRFRAFAVMLLASAVLMGVAVLWAGIDVHRDFLPVLKNMGYGKSTWAQAGMTFYRDPTNQSFNSLFHHLFGNDPSGNIRAWAATRGFVPNALTWAAFLGCFALALGRMVADIGRKAPDAAPRAFALCILVALLAPSIYWDHYAVIALWPLLMFGARLHPKVRAGASLTMAGGALALGSFQAGGEFYAIGAIVMGAAVGGVFSAGRPLSERMVGFAWATAGATLLCRYIYDWPSFRQGPWLLLMSVRLWGTLILLALWLFARGIRESENA